MFINRKNLILLLMCVELLLLSANFNFVAFSRFLPDIHGQIFVFFVLTLREISGDRRLMWFAIVAWPFATSQIRGQGAAYAANVNKALVALITCMLVGAAAFSASANLHRFAK